MTNEKQEEGRKNTHSRKYILMILSVIASIALWLFVVDSVNPVLSRTFTDIPVEVLNLESLADRDLAAVEEIEEYVNIRVNGNRNSILKLTNEDLVAAIDLSGCSEGDNYVDVNVHMPSSAELESISKPQILVSLESVITEERAVKVRFKGDTSEQMEAVCESQELDTAEVRGAKSLVSQVNFIEASIDTALLEDETDALTVELTPVDKDDKKIDNLTVTPEDMEVRAAIYKVKSVPLKVETVGSLPDGLELESIKAPETVLLAIPAAKADGLDSVSAKPVDLSSVTENKTVELELILPDKVRLAAGESVPKAAVTVKKSEQQEQ